LGVRISLSGRVSIEANGASLDERSLAGRQGRLVLAYLVAAEGRPVPRDELAEVLWGDAPPARWEKALSVLVSKLRALLEDCGVDSQAALRSAFGCYQLVLPPGAWIDVAAAREAANRAEAALGAGGIAAAREAAAEAAALARRTFLPGEDGFWVEEKRRELSAILVRSLECLADACLAAGDAREAVRHAEELVALEPYREGGYRRLMHAHTAAGDSAEALRVYERCRRLLANELGAYPSPETESIYRDLLRAPTSDGHAASPETGVSVVEPAPLRTGAGETAFPPPESLRQGGGRRRRRLVLAALVVVSAVAAAAVYSATRDESSLGTAEDPISIFTPWFEGDPEHRAFVDVLRAFEQTTGLKTETVEAGDARIVPGYRPTLAFTPSPGQLAEYVRDGTAEPLASLELTDAVLERAFARSWIELGTVNGAVYGVPLATTSKSLVWYRPREFRRLGLRPPRTWNDLVAVTERLARGGRKPWALGGSDSFTLTDWFENIYIRTEGPWKYDGLFAGKLPFDDPSVVAALTRMTTVLNERYLAEGVDGALAMSFLDALDAVFGADPRADLLMEGGFVASLSLGGAVKPAPVPGATIGASVFPTIDASFGSPVVAGGDFIVAFDDDPKVRRLLLYLMSPAAGRIWVSHGTVVSANKLVPLSAYPNELMRTAARHVTTAQVVRFDGSDLLPSELAEDLGRILQEVIRRPAAAPKLMKDFQRAARRTFSR
jgi:DNA-binding SARP family transcriptional activator/ABC-type glycerol-3-phosphate transport system substrate-binding protein